MEDDSSNKKPRWLTANKQFYRKFKKQRDKLIENLTPAEAILWEYLKSKKLGVKFRKQHIIDFYIPDFVALSIKLIIEVDGKIHLKQKKEDDERTRRLESIGYTIIRFTNEEVENNIDNIVERIKKEIRTLIPPNLPEREE